MTGVCRKNVSGFASTFNSLWLEFAEHFSCSILRLVIKTDGLSYLLWLYKIMKLEKNVNE